MTSRTATSNSPNERGDSSRTIVDFLAGDCFVMLGGAIWTFLATFLAASREPRDGARGLLRAASP